MAEGVQVVVRDPYLRFFSVQGYGTLLVLHLVSDLELGPTGVGVVNAIGSAGGLLGALVATFLGSRCTRPPTASGTSTASTLLH